MSIYNNEAQEENQSGKASIKYFLGFNYAVLAEKQDSEILK